MYFREVIPSFDETLPWHERTKLEWLPRFWRLGKSEELEEQQPLACRACAREETRVGPL